MMDISFFMIFNVMNVWKKNHCSALNINITTHRNTSMEDFHLINKLRSEWTEFNRKNSHRKFVGFNSAMSTHLVILHKSTKPKRSDLNSRSDVYQLALDWKSFDKRRQRKKMPNKIYRGHRLAAAAASIVNSLHMK